MAWLETISETARPAPNRLACRRTNQLPMPASGASTTRFGMRTPPSVHGSVRERPTRAMVGLTARALVDEAQAGESEQVVDLLDAVRMGHDVVGQTARGDRRRLLAQLRAKALDDPVAHRRRA